jgi:hypothetical protein
MNALKNILKSQSGATLTNTIIGATLLSGLAILVTQGITQQRTQSINLNTALSCQSAIKNSMDLFKTIDNNKQGNVDWTPTRWRDTATNNLSEDFDPTDDYSSRYNFKVIYDGANAVLNAEPIGAIAPAPMPVAVNHLALTAPMNTGACAAPCTTENTTYNATAQQTAANSVLTYQGLNSAASRLAYQYNTDPNFCTPTGVRVDNDPALNAALGINLIGPAAGLSGFQEMRMQIQRVNLLTGAVDCGAQGSFRPIPAGSSGAASLSPYGLQVTLIIDVIEDNELRSCVMRNNFSQSDLETTPTINTPIISSVDPTAQPDAGSPEFCGSGPSASGAGDESTPEINVRIRGGGEGIALFCRIEFMDSNRGDATAPAGYAYADSGWFHCKTPVTNFQAGVDPAAIDPNDIIGSVRDNAANRANIVIENTTTATDPSANLRLRNLPEGKFTISTFSVDASQSASQIRSSSFYIDLLRPLATTGVAPEAGGVIGQFDEPSVRIHELRAQFPYVDNINALETTVRAAFRSNNKIYQCKPGKAVFGMTGYDELYPVTDGGVRWYFGPSDVTDANLNTMLQYSAAEINTFNSSTAASHPVKSHDKEMIVDPNGGSCTESRCEGPILDSSAHSGEWVAIGLPKDDCGFGYSQSTSRRPWVVDMEHRPESPVASQDPEAGISVDIENGVAFVTKRRPSFIYQVSGSKPKHRVGAQAGVKQLPHLYLCEIAGPPSGGEEAPGNTTKSFYQYVTQDIYQTFGVPASTYNPANGIYDLTYNSALDSATGTCIQGNFQNSCKQDPSGELGVAVIDACGRVKGADVEYEVEGISNYPTAPRKNDSCSDVNCAPGYYCDKVGAGQGTCKHPMEVVWSGVGNNRGSYPTVNCSGSTCSSVPQCGTNADCQNDVTSGLTCSGQRVGCTGGGAPFANITGTYSTGTHIDCVSTAQKTSYQNYTTPPGTAACQYTNNQGDACSFTEVHQNTHNRHQVSGHSPQEVCPPIGSQYDWGTGASSTSCTDYDSAGACPSNGTACSTPGAVQYCSSGRSQSFQWNIVNEGANCTSTGPTCSGSMVWQTWSLEDQSCTGLGPVFCPVGQTCSSASDLLNRQCTSVSGGSKCHVEYCDCSGTMSGGGTTCPTSLGDCSTVAPASKCDESSELGQSYKCDDGTNVYTYTCTRTCNTPTKSCQLANTTPPWLDDSNNVTITFNGQCNVQMGSCSSPTRSKSNAGATTLTCPNLDPLSPICRNVTCADEEANYCSGVDFDLDVPACMGGGTLSCTGTATPNCGHLPGYTLLNQSVTQCLANGYDDCRPASTTCTGRTYTCGARTTCTAQEINYSDRASCEAIHGAGNCVDLLNGQACGQGCHPNVANQGTSEASCNGSGNYNCVKLHDPVSGVNNWCATSCDVSSGAITFDTLADCTNAGNSTCNSREVIVGSGANKGQLKTVYCAGTGDCGPGEAKYNDIYQCLADNSFDITKCTITRRGGTCQTLADCGGATVYYEDDLSCNGASASVGSMVSNACCNGNSNCKYVQNYEYLNDDTGTLQDVRVFCASSAQSVAWVVTNPSISISRSACEAEVYPISACPNSQCQSSADIGKTCKKKTAPCSTTGSSSAQQMECQSVSTPPSSEVWTSGKCATVPTKWRQKGNTTETNCGGGLPVNEKWCYENNYGTPGAPNHAVGYNADGTGPVGPGTVGSWVYFYTANAGSSPSSYYDAEVYCEPDTSSVGGVKQWTTGECDDTPERFRTIETPTYSNSIGWYAMSNGECTGWRSACGGSSAADSTMCIDEEDAPCSSPSIATCGNDSHIEEHTVEYRSSLGKWRYNAILDNVYSGAACTDSITVDVEVYCTPKGGSTSPPPISCQSYACTAQAPGCWELTNSQTDMSTINGAGYPSSRCTGDCPGGREPTNGDACIIGQNAEVDWKYGTRWWSCTDSCSGTPTTCSWNVTQRGEMCNSPASCANHGVDSRFGYDQPVNDGDPCISGERDRIWASQTETYGGVPYTRRESVANCSCNNDPCQTPGVCEWESKFRTGTEVGNDGCSWQGTTCNQLGESRVCCGSRGTWNGSGCTHNSNPRAIIDPIVAQCLIK